MPFKELYRFSLTSAAIGLCFFSLAMSAEERGDPAAKKASAIAAYLSGDTAQGDAIVQELKEQGVVSEEFYVELAFAYLTQERPLDAISWFDKAEGSDPAVEAGKCFAAFQLDSWQEAMDCVQRLPGHYQALDAYRAIAIESLASMGEFNQADAALGALLSSPPQPSIDSYPEFFHPFYRWLHLWDRYYVAGLYTWAVKNNPQQAAAYMERIESPLPVQEVQKAEIYLEIGDVFKAKETLDRVAEKIKGNKQEEEVQLKLLPLLAQATYRLGYYVEAVDIYKNYFLENPADVSYRLLYALALMTVQRYDLALSQFEEVKKHQPLPGPWMARYIKSLVKTGQFEAANQEALSYLGTGNVPLLYQMQIARLMILTGYQALQEAVVAAVEKRRSSTLQDNQELILLWTDLAEYGKATAIADLEKSGLESTPQGLLVLVELMGRLSRYSEAEKFALLAFHQAPTNPEVVKMMEQYEKSPSALAQSVKLFREKLHSNPESFTLKLDLAKTLVELFVETAISGSLKSFQESRDLQEARKILEELVVLNQGIPEVFFLLGKVYYFLDKTDEAKAAFEKALTLDVSYVDVYQYLSLMEEDEGNTSAAAALLTAAQTFDPFKLSIRLQLAELLLKEKKANAAIEEATKASVYYPHAPEPYMLLGKVYLAERQPASAVASLEQALERSPRNKEAVKLMIIALYDEKYRAGIQDQERLTRRQLLLFDRLEALDPSEAQALREKLGIVN